VLPADETASRVSIRGILGVTYPMLKVAERGKFEPTGPVENAQLIHFPALPRRMILPIGRSNVHRSECGNARLFLAVGIRPSRLGANPQQAFSTVSPIREPDLAGNNVKRRSLDIPFQLIGWLRIYLDSVGRSYQNTRHHPCWQGVPQLPQDKLATV
jgi:hypothetical protein